MAEFVDMSRRVGVSVGPGREFVVRHVDVDHVQGMARAKELLPEAKLVGHPGAAELLAEGERISTYAEIAAQGISIDAARLARTRRDTEAVSALFRISLPRKPSCRNRPRSIRLRPNDRLDRSPHLFTFCNFSAR